MTTIVTYLPADFDQEALFDKEIEPLVNELRNKCLAAGIPLLLAACLRSKKQSDSTIQSCVRGISDLNDGSPHGFFIAAEAIRCNYKKAAALASALDETSSITNREEVELPA